MNNSTETVFSSISIEDSDLKKKINKARVKAINDHKYYSYLEDQKKKLSFHTLKNVEDFAKKFNLKKPKKTTQVKTSSIKKNTQVKTSNKKFISLLISVLSIIFIFYIIYQNK